MQLKLPRKIKIRNRTYVVRRDAKVPLSALADIDVRARLIRISTKKLANSEVAGAFWHEVTHAILHDMRSPKWASEKFVTAFSDRLTNVFMGLRA
ncbi:MAG: hypothetical protein FJY51_10480 [Betaproteobacteria bacterium]|nr:hypothetical protein [Betaproteobacteria bacterium]